AHNVRIHPGKLKDCFPKNGLIFWGLVFFFGAYYALACKFVEETGGVEPGLFLFGKGISFPFNRNNMKQFWALDVFEVVEDAG
ncbi:hypothetical protein, partial [Klebsiella pneumoniae]|uniref:hypothetical protein n=1 Tax=Klebsiella pneumoniae TaxID=573 RepID=UPI00272F0134